MYLAHKSLAWEQREKGSCGGMIWYELKLFPNRLHRVWSCPPTLSGGLLPPISTMYCVTLAPTSSIPFLLFTVKCTANNNNGFIFSMTLWLKVPQLYYLWLAEGQGSVVQEFSHAALLPPPPPGSGLSVSFFVGNQSQVLGQKERLSTARGNDCAFCLTLYPKVVSLCSWSPSAVVCGLIGEYMGLFFFWHI